MINEVSQGGDWTHVVDLANRQADRGDEIVVAGRWAGYRAGQFRGGVEVRDCQFPPRGLTNVIQWGRLMGMVATGGPNTIVHVHSVRAIVAAVLCGWGRRRIVLTRHLDVQSAGWRRRLERWLLGRVDAVLVPSEATETSVLQLDAGLSGVVKLIPLGIDTTRFVPPTQRGEGASAETVHWGYAGRLHPIKRVEWVINLLTDSQYADVHLTIAGDGPMMGALKHLAKSSGVNDQITFLGFQRDLSSFYHSIDLLLMPSDMEVFGLAVSKLCCAGCRWFAA